MMDRENVAAVCSSINCCEFSQLKLNPNNPGEMMLMEVSQSTVRVIGEESGWRAREEESDSIDS